MHITPVSQNIYLKLAILGGKTEKVTTTGPKQQSTRQRVIARGITFIPRLSQQQTTFLPFLWNATAAHYTQQSWKQPLAQRVLGLPQALTRGFTAVPPLRSASKTIAKWFTAGSATATSLGQHERCVCSRRGKPSARPSVCSEGRGRGRGKKPTAKKPLNYNLQEVTPGCSTGEKTACCAQQSPPLRARGLGAPAGARAAAPPLPAAAGGGPVAASPATQPRAAPRGLPTSGSGRS